MTNCGVQGMDTLPLGLTDQNVFPKSPWTVHGNTTHVCIMHYVIFICTTAITICHCKGIAQTFGILINSLNQNLVAVSCNMSINAAAISKKFSSSKNARDILKE